MTITDFFTNTSQLKQFIRGIDINTQIDSFAPMYRHAAKRFVNLVGQETYDLLKGHIATPPTPAAPNLDLAVNYSRAAIANMLAITWFTFDAGERNNTDKKLYRYQEDKILETYLENAWAELDLLLILFESDTTLFSDFAASDMFTERENLYIKTTAEFNKFYGIDNSAYFYYKTVFIMREIQEEEIFSRVKDTDSLPEGNNIAWYIGKAIAFETVARACQRFDYSELPRGLRNEITKEIGGSVNRGELGNIKDTIYARLHNKAIEYLQKLETELHVAKTEDLTTYPLDVNDEDNKFFLTT